MISVHPRSSAAKNTYVELHARSAFSFLQGSSTPEELITRAASLGFPALALLDHDNVSGAPRFHMAAKKAGLRAHIGAEITCTDGHRYPLLAENRAGYQNISRLITRMKLRAKKGEGAAIPEELAEFSKGIVCLADRPDPNIIDLFGAKNVYLELQRHFNRNQEAHNQMLVDFARSRNLPLLATNGVSHAAPQAREALDILTCVRNKVTIHEAGRLLSINSERYLKDARQMERIFRDHPDAIANTRELSDRLQFTLADLGYQFPKYPVPPGENMNSFLRQCVAKGERERYYPNAFTAELCRRAHAQIQKELALIEKLDLAGYFLIVWDIVEFCRSQNILVQGRGSAANSAVCYALGITAVDAVAMELLFERFLSEERGEWPDIDLDLPSGDQRERVIQHVYKRYGERGAAMTANVITYRNRMAARDMGKALGFDPETLAKISAAVATWEFRDENDALDRRFRDAGLDLTHPRLRKYYELCIAVQDMPRHLSQHSGGMVICQGQLDSVVPLEPASMPGRVVVQWDKEDCADMGIIKVDLLGLGMMAVLKDSIELVRNHYHEEVDLAHLPHDDQQVYSTLQQADTVGMFQVESRAQMSCLPRLRPVRFYDVVVQVAIIRPGPIVGQMVNPFLQRRQGKEKVTYPHPSLETVLERTLGVPLFQEQLLRIAMIAANFSGGEAEELRRAMGFKRSQARMREIEAKLRAGMTANGISPKAQEEIILSITSFALYGFPESHAASFALIAYASAYLKCHYLAAFTAALLNNQPMGFYSPATIVKDAQRHGLKLLPIDVTCSEWNCTLETEPGCQCPVPSASVPGRESRVASEGRTVPSCEHRVPSESESESSSGLNTRDSQLSPALRMGLRYVRGLREEAGLALVRERAKAPFFSIHDLARRVPELRKDELNTLAEIGALNAVARELPIGSNTSSCVEQSTIKNQQSTIPHLGDRQSAIANPFHRRDALWQVERAVRASGPLLEQHAEPDSRSPLERMSHEERLVADFHGTGLTVGPHPMAYKREWLNAMGIRRASELRDLPSGKRLRIGGCVITRQRPGTAKGFVFISLEDETGVANAIIRPDLFHQNRLMLASERFLAIEGILQNQDNVISVRAERVLPLFVTKAETVSHDFH